jgi:hypothetical protein
MPQRTVFYSWQSDLPNATNRGLIAKALENAARSIHSDPTVEVEPVVDRDTYGVGGSPDIARTILSKIEACDVFVCDVSIINEEALEKGVMKRPAPNPNVLIELGYAVKALGEGRVIMVMNTAYGSPEQLPFDLRGKRVIEYSIPEAQQERAPARRGLERSLERNLRAIFDGFASEEEETAASPAEVFDSLLNDHGATRRAQQLILSEADKLSAELRSPKFDAHVQSYAHNLLAAYMRMYEESVTPLVSLFVLGCHDGGPPLARAWSGALARVANAAEPYGNRKELINLRLYPALLLLYAGGVAAVAGERYEHLASMLGKVTVNDLHVPKGWPVTYALVPARVIDEGAAKYIMGGGDHLRHPLRINTYLLQLLRNSLKELIPDDREYVDYFVRFEYFFALSVAASNRDLFGSVAVPVGTYMWEPQLRHPRHHVINETNMEIERAGADWPPISDSLFDGPLEGFQRFKREADERIVSLINDDYPNWKLSQ